MEFYSEGEPVYRVCYGVFLENEQELVLSNDSPCNMSGSARFFPSCVQPELVRRSAGERLWIPTTVDLAAFGVRESVLIQVMPLADFSQDIEAEPGALIEFSVDSDSVGVGRVFEVDDRRVKVEFKHPLIGNNLRFDVEVLAVIEGCT